MDLQHKVSIVMATYNRAHFIVETLQSITNQTYKNWECIIIDDGGTDNTLEIITPILEQDSRFNFSKRPSSYGKGLPGCRNYGIDSATGDYIIFFDDDDIVHPQNLELCVNELKLDKYKYCRYVRTVFHGDFDYKFDDTESFGKFEILQQDLSKMIDHTIPFNSCAVMWSKKCFEGVRFTETLMYAEEWECYVRILSEDIKGISIDKTLFYGRKHQESNTGEFIKHNPKRVNSKKEATYLIAKHLAEKRLLSDYLLKYLSSIAITFRDKTLLNKILVVSNHGTSQQLFSNFKFAMYPIWSVYNRMKKKVKNNI
ncbi:glycosyltransferase family 2 protein [Ulvibacter antarcticus]|uniref:Glycosyltransferase involved in cell wall biosynthesis n=1 Tax=Ulvibacter antarcticus TaxID=442714 RepID=A0A3L9YFR5_9FLAO|nr:glycosyltransferase family 2 protein [Ulvibacter antarcticus]RMA57979.1 glycosyltransferase involved in cell wall biosynthesis [Ulvibacter antarcticus]